MGRRFAGRCHVQRRPWPVLALQGPVVQDLEAGNQPSLLLLQQLDVPVVPFYQQMQSHFWNQESLQTPADTILALVSLSCIHILGCPACNVNMEYHQHTVVDQAVRMLR